MTHVRRNAILLLLTLVTTPHRVFTAQDPAQIRQHLADADVLFAQGLREPVEQSTAAYRRVVDEATRSKLTDVVAAAELGLGKSLEWFGKFDEAREHHRVAADRFRELGQPAKEAEALVHVARCQFGVGDGKAGSATIAAALSMARQAGDRRVLGMALNTAGDSTDSADASRTQAVLDEAIAVTRAAGDKVELADCLRSLGYKLMFSKGAAAAHPVFEEAVAVSREAGDTRSLGSSLSLLALVTGNRERALELYLESLALSRRAGHDIQAGWTISGIAILYYENGQYTLALQKFQEALTLRRRIGQRTTIGENLSNIGNTLGALGRRAEQVPYLQEALELHRAYGYLDGQAITLVSLAAVAARSGDAQRALSLAVEALDVARRAGNRRNEALAHSATAHAYLNLGRYRDAVAAYTTAREITQEGGNLRLTLAAERYLGRTWALLGSRDQAIDHYSRAASIAEKIAEKDEIAVITSHLALLQAETGDFAGVDAKVKRALTLAQSGENPVARVRVYDRAGSVALLRGDPQRAIELFSLEVDAIKQMGQAEGLAAALTQLGRAHARTRARARALPYFEQALAASAVANDSAVEAMTLVALMDYWRTEQRWNVAAFFGKQAVEIFQRARSDLRQMDDAVQQRFVESRADVYRDLADVLISSGRLIEAQQVLDLLKKEEFQDFVRRTGSQAGSQGTLTPTETRLFEGYREIQDRVMAIGAKRRELLLIKQRSDVEETQLQAVEADLEVANAAFHANIKQLVADLGRGQAAADRKAMIDAAQPLMADLRLIGDGSVMVYVLVAPARTHLLLFSAEARKSVSVKIEAAALNHRIQAFRRALQNPSLDPRPAGQELYRILVAPIARDLEQAKARSIVWVLDQRLRYVPMAALHDGRRYLAETYRSVLATRASERRLTDPAIANWAGLGVGVSRSIEGFAGLPFVAEELRTIFAEAGAPGNGLVPGRVLIDDAFTGASFREGLRGQSPVVHVASHFRFRPGNDEDSFLLLGDGSHLTLAEVTRQTELFEGVELLTLSACDTAVGDAGATGDEVESFGVLAQQQGAKAVIAGLWSVADESTRVWMETFYRGKVEQNLDKAEAVRQAQLAMITGHSTPSASSANGARGVTPVASVRDKPFVAPANAPWAHPYYWAPFILMGNWR